MSVYITAQAVRVFITNPAGNELEVTSLLVSLVTENDRCGTGDDLKGYFKTTGTLILNGQLPVGFAESLDPRNNDRWRQGNLVRVLIRRRNGVEVSHPRGALRILQTPNPTRRQGNLNIKVGCELAYLDTIGEPESNSGFTIPPNGLTRRAAINLLADRAGIPQLGTEISSPNIFRIRSRLEGNRVEEIGNLALAASHFVWMNNARTMSATQFNLDATPTFTGLDADRDFSDFSIQLSDEPVPDDIAVSTKRTSISIKVSEANAFAGDVFANPSVLTTGEDATRGELFPEVYRGDSGLTAASRTTVTKTYSAEGWLITDQEVNRSPKGLIFPETFPGDLNLETNNRKTTTYTLGIESKVYGSTPVINYFVSEIKTVTEEPEGLVNPAATDPLVLVTTKVEKRIFSRIGNDWAETTKSWDKRTGESSCRIPIERMVAPPAPTPRPTPTDSRDVEDLGETAFEALPPRRKRTFRFNMNVQGSDQTQNLANLIGRLQYGATQLAEWECDIPDAFLAGSYAPQQVWEIADQGFTYRYLSDGHIFACTADSAVFRCVGYYLGRVQGGLVIPPYRVAARMFLSTVFTSSADATPLNLPSLQLTTTITGAIAAQENTAGVFGGATFTTTITGAINALVPSSASMDLITTSDGSVNMTPVAPWVQPASVFWFRPDSDKITRDASNRVSQWRRSPSNHPSWAAGQTTVASQPIWSASNGPNARPSVTFNGAEGYLFSASASQAITGIYIVFRPNATFGSFAGILSIAETATKVPASTENLMIRAPSGGGSSIGLVGFNSTDDPMISGVYVNGVIQTLSPNPASGFTFPVTVGAWQWVLVTFASSQVATKSYVLGADAFGGVGVRHAAVAIAEYHIYTQPLTEDRIRQIIDYLDSYYGI